MSGNAKTRRGFSSCSLTFAKEKAKEARGLSESVKTKEVPNEEIDGIQVLTIHAAKGLEWPVVFVANVNEGILPLNRGGGNVCGGRNNALRVGSADLQEERRLCYVAMTRAQSRLCEFLNWDFG